MSTSPDGSFDGGDGDDANFQGAGTSDGDDSPATVTESAVDWDSLAGVPGELKKFAKNPKTFILGTVIVWLVKTLIITPTQYTIAFIDLAFQKVEDMIGMSLDSVGLGLAPVATAVTSIPSMILGSMRGGLVNLGLGAPLAGTLAAVVVAFVFGALVVIILRVVADVVPGVGGLIR
ncbi:hypothetical protein [Haladaptatus sp. CMSO5]|uniref:hypothetical protein n=1 Tax=Haladaptatus sp. CMSO5 TaxID=3120514 RepID=UPI002FCE2A8E